MISTDAIPELIDALTKFAEDPYYDLRGASGYSSMAVSTIRDHISFGSLPAYKVGGKILIRRSEFDSWIEAFQINKKQDLNVLVDDVLNNLKGG